MEFRRSGGRDERRRRVLLDEPNGGADQSSGAATTDTSAAAGASSARSAPDYAEAARAVRQLRLSDLMPRKAHMLTGLTALATLLASAVVAAAWYAPGWSWLNPPAREIFSTSARGNLASWFASMLLLLSAAWAMQIYLLRRHKVNDYRGRYRLWVPVAASLFLGSADAVIGLRHLLGSAVSAVMPSAWIASVELAWMLPFGLLVTALGIRLTIETRRSYGTLTALGFCALAYLASAVVHVQPQVISLAGATEARVAVVVSLAAQLAGHVLLLLTVMLYGRYVFLAANGLLTVREPRAARQPRPKKQRADKRAVSPESSTVDDEAQASDRSPKQKAAAAKSSAKPAVAKPPAEKPRAQESKPAKTAGKASIDKSSSVAAKNKSEADDQPATLSIEELAHREDLSPDDTAHLSKAERRRLRKLQKRSNRAA
jgi:hypothetical protein